MIAPQVAVSAQPTLTDALRTLVLACQLKPLLAGRQAKEGGAKQVLDVLSAWLAEAQTGSGWGHARLNEQYFGQLVRQTAHPSLPATLEDVAKWSCKKPLELVRLFIYDAGLASWVQNTEPTLKGQQRLAISPQLENETARLARFGEIELMAAQMQLRMLAHPMLIFVLASRSKNPPALGHM